MKEAFSSFIAQKFFACDFKPQFGTHLNFGPLPGAVKKIQKSCKRIFEVMEEIIDATPHCRKCTENAPV